MGFLQHAVIAVAIFLNTFVSGALGFFHLASSTPINTAVQNIQPSFAPQTSITTSVNNTNSAQVTSSTSSPSLSTPTSYNPYGCYEQIGNSVLLNQNGTSINLPRADLKTFVDLSQFNLCFGKDKNHVYHDDQILSWADPSTFSVLWYDHGPVFFFRNAMQIVAWTQGNSFRPSPNSIPIVDQNGPPGFYIVPGGDPSTFQTIFGAYDIAPWAKDKNNVYCNGKIMQDADPSTAELVDNDEHLRVLVDGKPHIYEGCTIIASSTAS
jgi:hypothetical protein